MRIRLRTFLIFFTAIAAVLISVGNWRSRSMTQFNALNTDELNTDDLSNRPVTAEFPWELSFATDGTLGPSADAGLNRYRFQAWLAQYFDPSYACDCVNVISPGHGLSEMKYVEKLKGVKLIVLREDPDTAILDKWRKRFPGTRVITWPEWEAMESKRNTPK